MYTAFQLTKLQSLVSFKIWAATRQNQQSDCAPSEDSDQPGHPPSLIRVFAVRMKKAWVLIYPLSAQRRLWSDWADAQADLSLRWAHSHIVGFVMSRLILLKQGEVYNSLKNWCNNAFHREKPVQGQLFVWSTGRITKTKRIKTWNCCCLFGFNVAFNNFSVISRRCLVATGSSMLESCSAASLKYHAPDTWHDTTPSHIILTLGRPVLALSRKSECQARSS